MKTEGYLPLLWNDSGNLNQKRTLQKLPTAGAFIKHATSTRPINNVPKLVSTRAAPESPVAPIAEAGLVVGAAKAVGVAVGATEGAFACVGVDVGSAARKVAVGDGVGGAEAAEGSRVGVSA